MTDEHRPDEASTPETANPTPATEASAGPETQAQGETATATAEAPPKEQGEKKEEKIKLRQDVEIKDLGACRKHIKITINREDIDARFKDHFKKLVHEANMPGFRPGKAPRQLVEKRFQKDVAERVKSEVLMASLQQLGEDHDVAPLAQPQLDIEKIDLPKEGPMFYEFVVEVRPEFDLPPYKGLKLKRPIKTYTEADVAEARRQLLTEQAQIVPKPEGNAQLGDLVIADVVVRDGDRQVGTIQESQFLVENQLAFRDGLCRRFAEQIKGAKAGDIREVDIEMSQASPIPELAGKTVKGSFNIKEVKSLIMPELTPEFLAQFGIQTPAQLDELILGMLNRRLDHIQRRWARDQVMQMIASTANWDLPPELLKRQAAKARDRRRMEMKADGIPDAQINAEIRRLEQDIVRSTELLLKEHFVLQKIAEAEKIELDEDDLNDEIERLAEQSGESPRRLRARLEKEDRLESLAAEMIEREALNLIMEHAEYEDVSLDKTEADSGLATVEAQAVSGEMRDPSAPEEPAESPPSTEATP